MTDPNDMEDPQAGEILPPMLYEAWWENCLCDIEICESNRIFRRGMEFAYQQLKPLMQAALPYFEAGVCDTRLGQADAGKLADLAQLKEIAEYEK